MGKRKMDSDLHRIKLETGTVYQTRKGGNYYFRYQIKGERKCVRSKFLIYNDYHSYNNNHIGKIA